MTTSILSLVLKPLAPVNASLSVWARNTAAALMFAMTLIILLQVFYRYVLADSLSWTEELAKILMVWSVFLVAPWAYRTGANVSIQLFVDAFSKRSRLVFQVVTNVLVVWILSRLLGEAVDFWLSGFSVISASMPVSMGWFYTIVPFSLAGLILVGSELLIRDLLSLMNAEQDYSIPGVSAPMEGE